MLSVVGCGHTPVTQTLADAFGRGGDVSTVALRPDFNYLKVTAYGRDTLMVLGYADPHPIGTIESWFSSQGEILRLQNGRILSSAGLELDWHAVRYTGLPDWIGVVNRNNAEFSRERDEMPGHRFGLVDRIALYLVPAPKDAHLIGVDPTTLMWFEERANAGLAQLPSARYGLRLEAGNPRVVYGEQCLTDRFCIAWQSWPANE